MVLLSLKKPFFFFGKNWYLSKKINRFQILFFLFQKKFIQINLACQVVLFFNLYLHLADEFFVLMVMDVPLCCHLSCDYRPYIIRDEDNYQGARAVIGGRKNNLLFITYYENNISVYNLNKFKFMKHEILRGAWIQYHCFVSKSENGQVQDMVKMNDTKNKSKKKKRKS
ncbi:hypothetical protein RFI_32145 [Reticulomyxa filosa]|uniref:Uncharacterized protein n=1 Tax=Reticulomyxa filosa TaxID=46433 RepID=X6LUE3_RETFI|nr:hypothetical protein RFI_32145 [Reticulomyxa filosa]|eukprot:ETO05249.1 hypothetical protein RFI_32145 [Reticulomyxa filosa]